MYIPYDAYDDFGYSNSKGMTALNYISKCGTFILIMNVYYWIIK